MAETPLAFIAGLNALFRSRTSAVRVYVAGPMTGLPDLNFPAFHAAAARLRALGYEAINPAELNADQASDWTECMRRDLAALATCDGLVLLPGWRYSRGANLERDMAQRLGLVVRELRRVPREPGQFLCGNWRG